MKIKEQLVKELDSLKPSDALMVYGLMLSLRGREKVAAQTSRSYIKVREALSAYKGVMSKDILSAREDRI